MNRIDEVKRLQEQEADATPAPWNSETPFDVHDIFDNGKFLESMRNAAPWLLAVAGKFQPGDSDLMERWLNFQVSDYEVAVVVQRIQEAAKVLEEEDVN